MKNQCLYHKISKQIKRQKGSSNSSKHTNKMCLQQQKCIFSQKETNNLKSDYQDLNDYNLSATKDKGRKIKLFTEIPQTKIQITKKKKNDMLNSRYHKKFDQQYFINDRNCPKSTRSHKPKNQDIFSEGNNFEILYKQRKTFEKIQQRLHCDKIEQLQNKIEALTRKLQTCEAQTTKNHYQFMLLREIVEKMKIQNLQIISKLALEQNFVKLSGECRIDKELEGQFLSQNVIAEDKDNNISNATKNLMIAQQSQIKSSISFLQQKMEYSASDNDQKTVSSKKLENYLCLDQKNFRPQFRAKKNPKPYQQSVKLTNQNQHQTIFKQQNNQLYRNEINVKQYVQCSDSAQRKNKKKVIRFQNNLKQEELQKKKQLISSHQIEDLLVNESQKKLERSSSMIASEENLLSSIKMIQQNRYRQIYENNQKEFASSKYSQTHDHDTSLICQQISYLYPEQNKNLSKLDHQVITNKHRLLQNK